MNYEMVKMRTAHIRPSSYAAAGRLVLKFIETAQTASNRATANNSRAEVNDAAGVVHEALFAIDRGIYAALLRLPGMLDTARQQGVLRLLGSARTGEPATLRLPEETDVIQSLVDLMPRHRQLNLFLMLKAKGVNNARTQKLILRTILSWDNLPWAAVKYRRKVRVALRHAWGIRLTSIIQKILDKGIESDKEAGIANNNLLGYFKGQAAGNDTATGCEFVSFCLGNRGLFGRPFGSDLLRAYQDAPADYNALARLPPEIAQDFRARYHKSRSVADVMEKTEKNLTVKQRVRVQKQAKEMGVKVDLRVDQQDLVDLLVLRYEVGDQDGLDEKIEASIRTMPSLGYRSIGVVRDLSRSMMGSSEQKWRPAAWVRAMDVALVASAGEATGVTVGGDDNLKPSGDTDLAEGLVNLLVVADGYGSDLDAIFVLTDGYENAPAGRFAEVVHALRGMGNHIPIYQVTPTFAAEAYGVRQLSPEVPVLTVGTKIEQLAIRLNERMIETDFIRGLAALFEQAQLHLQGA